MHRSGIVVLLLAACGASPRTTDTPANSVAGTSSTKPRCTQRTTASAPLSEAELEHARAPADLDAARELLRGVWDGHGYSLDGELGEPGVTPTVEEPTLACFDVVGRMTTPSEIAERSPFAGCVARARTFELLRNEEAGNVLMLEVSRTGGCPGDAGYHKPYTSPYYVHRLDERYLVLIDGVTGSVTGYRRR